MMALLWRDALHDLASSRSHFEEAVAMFDDPSFPGPQGPDYIRRMAFPHAMQSGYSSFEAALKRIFALLGEPVPVGSDWHFALLRRASEPIEGLRPEILGQDLAAHAGELMRFRHVAMHAYDRFNVRKAAIAADAARAFLQGVDADLARFRAIVDP